MKSDLSVITALKLTSEIYGRQMSDAAAALFFSDLDSYPAGAVVTALARCRKELRTFPTIADIVARIDDGRPGPEEAWAMIPKDEAGSVVWTDEMATAFGPASSLIADDPIAARMAFRESYSKLLAEARDRKIPARWTPSFGRDASDRERAVREAVDKGRLEIGHASSLVPEIEFKPSPEMKRLAADVGHPMPKGDE